MIKNFLIYEIVGDLKIEASVLESALDSARFVSCGASEEQSLGWIEPRGEEHGALLESVGGHWILQAKLETRSLPSSEINKQAQLRAKDIEAQSGRKPGKKELKDIKEQVHLELMPRAFSKESQTLLWIDPVNRWLVVGAGSAARADDVITLLLKSVVGLAVKPIETYMSPAKAMSDWLVSQESPAGFTVDRECELKAEDESKATIKYGKHPLDIEEVKAHVEGGKLPVKLAMTWEDRVSFVLTDTFQVKKLAFLDAVFDGASDNKKDDFDADVAIFTCEMVKFIPALFGALGDKLQSD